MWFKADQEERGCYEYLYSKNNMPNPCFPRFFCRELKYAIHRATKLSYQHSQKPKATGRTKSPGIPSPDWRTGEIRTCLTSDLNLRAWQVNTQIKGHFWGLSCST